VTRNKIRRCQDFFSKKEAELAKLQQAFASSVISAGKLTSQQSDRFTTELAQRQNSARGVITTALSRRLAAVGDRRARQKRITENEVSKSSITFCQWR